MAFSVQGCVDLDDSFVDSDSEFEAVSWYDDESDSNASYFSEQDAMPNPLQHPQISFGDILSIIHIDERQRHAYANPINLDQIFFGDCQVCFRTDYVIQRPCCKLVLCKSCYQTYIMEKIQLGMTEIECVNICQYLIHPKDIVNISSSQVLQKYRTSKMAKIRSSKFRECCCGNFIHIKDNVANFKKTKLICPRCRLALCLSCLRPWHEGVSCKKNQKTDKLLKSWAKGYLPGQPKAQKCPKCKIYIERISGCDHMSCTRCGTRFCFRCGEAFRSWKAFGDHSNKLSVFGCKYAFLPNKPFCRKFIRGFLFSTRVFAAIVVGTLAIGVGSAAVCVGAASLPFYGAVRLYKKLKRKKRSAIPESVSSAPCSPNCYFIRKIPSISGEIEQRDKHYKQPDFSPSISDVKHQSNRTETSSSNSTLNSMNANDLSDWITMKNKMLLRITLPDRDGENCCR